MIDEHIHVLLVEDNPADARLLWEAFRGEKNIRLTHVETLAQAVAKLRETTFNIIMLDLSLPDADGIGTLVTAQQHAPLLPIVVLTGTDDEVLAIRAVREGAQDYLVKGQVDAHLLLRAIRYATERKRVLSALQQREEWFRSLIENALDIITVLDVDGSVRYSSPSFERILGFALSDLAGTNIFELLHPDDAASTLR